MKTKRFLASNYLQLHTHIWIHFNGNRWYNTTRGLFGCFTFHFSIQTFNKCGFHIENRFVFNQFFVNVFNYIERACVFDSIQWKTWIIFCIFCDSISQFVLKLEVKCMYDWLKLLSHNKNQIRCCIYERVNLTRLMRVLFQIQWKCLFLKLNELEINQITANTFNSDDTIIYKLITKY